MSTSVTQLYAMLQLSDHILSSYDRAIGEYASQAFQRSGIELVLNSRVSEVTKNELTILCPDKTSKTIQFGACVWATGVLPLAFWLRASSQP